MMGQTLSDQCSAKHAYEGDMFKIGRRTIYNIKSMQYRKVLLGSLVNYSYTFN